MEEEFFNPTNMPGGPLAYLNWNMYGSTPPMARPSSPAFMNSMPDMMAREARNTGNSGIIGSGMPFNFGNPLLNMAGGMAMNAIFGPNMRPFQRPDMSAIDYVEGRQRQQTGLRYTGEINSLDAGLSRLGQAGNNPLVQMIYDQFNPHGSNNQAFSSIYGQMGTRFGSDLNSRAQQSMELTRQMNESFRAGPNGTKFDYNASYGFNRGELVEALDTSVRYGIGGMSDKRLREAVATGKGGELMKGQAKMFAAAGEIFGKDKGFDELAQLMGKTIDGFQGLDENKATSLLTRIQATARTINVSGKALAEFSGMMNGLYKSTGQGGASATGRILDSAIQAKAATEIGRQTGDANLADQNKSMESAGRNKADVMGSPTMKKAQAIAAQFEQLTPSQRTSIRMKDGSSAAAAFNKIQAAVQTGDPNKIQAAVQGFQAGLTSNPYMSSEGIEQNALNLSERDRQRAGKIMDFDTVGAVNGTAMRQRFAQELATEGNVSADVVQALGGQKGMESFLDELSSAKEATSSDAVKAKLRATGMAGEQLNRASAQIARQMEIKMSNGANLQGFGFQSVEDAENAFAVSSRQGRKMTRGDRAERRAQEQRIAKARDISGEVMRNYGFGGLMDDLIDILPKMDGQDINFDNVAKAFGDVGKSAAGVEGMTELLGNLNSKGISTTEANKMLQDAAKKAEDVRMEEEKRLGADKGSEESRAFAKNSAAKKAKDAFQKEIMAGGLGFLVGGKSSTEGPAGTSGSTEKPATEKASDKTDTGASKEDPMPTWKEISATLKNIEKYLEPKAQAVATKAARKEH